MGFDDPVKRDAAVAAAATLRRVPRTSILLGERAGGGRASVSNSLDAGVESPLPELSLMTLDAGSLSDSFSAFKADEGGVLLTSTLEVVPENILVGRGIKAESLFLLPLAVSPM
jgi:hypothetical protein